MALVTGELLGLFVHRNFNILDCQAHSSCVCFSVDAGKVATLDWVTSLVSSLHDVVLEYSARSKSLIFPEVRYIVQGAETWDHDVSMACRTSSRAEASILKIKEEVPDAHIEFIYFDLTILSSAKKTLEAFTAKEDQLDILINNAGIVE